MIRKILTILKHALLAVVLTLVSVLSPWPNISGRLESASINRPPRPVINNLGLPMGFVRVVNGSVEKIRWQPAVTDLACWFCLITAVATFRKQFSEDRALRMRRAGLCVKCGYILKGLNVLRCPECNTPFET